MKSIDIVLAEYIANSTELIDGRLRRKKVPNNPPSGAEIEIKANLPKLLLAEIERSGRHAKDYRVYGSVGQTNFPFARIPWVAALHREISTSTERGYYIVLLFREDMTGWVLSLNQGFTSFSEAFGTRSLATRKVRESAKIALTYLDVSPGFVRGVIDLAATGDLGIGYEQGAIVSKAYSSAKNVSVEQFSHDLSILLEAYDTLRKKLSYNIIDLVPEADDDEFQEAASAISRKKTKQEYEPPLPGPVPRPPRSHQPSGSGYRRDPRIAGKAISDSNYACAVAGSHVSFISRTTKQNFVEAHHLIPFEFQEMFDSSLDVLENVVVLCPTCHRKLHHGMLKDKKPVLKQLFEDRDAMLKSRGLNINLDTLVQYYRGELEETMSETTED